jgi:hypothetical protein
MFISTNTSMAQPAPDSARIRWRGIATDAEQESWNSAAVLLVHSSNCLAFYSPLATGEFDDVPFVIETKMDAIKRLVDAGAGRSGTPTNWWPVDRSRFVYTDWDLWETKVSGPVELVESNRNDDWLESIDWVRPYADGHGAVSSG